MSIGVGISCDRKSKKNLKGSWLEVVHKGFHCLNRGEYGLGFFADFLIEWRRCSYLFYLLTATCFQNLAEGEPRPFDLPV